MSIRGYAMSIKVQYTNEYKRELFTNVHKRESLTNVSLLSDCLCTVSIVMLVMYAISIQMYSVSSKGTH